MIILIEYDRTARRVIRRQDVSDSQLAEAEEVRLQLDLDINRSRYRGDREVVLLQAAKEEALRRTHRRYFETTEGLIGRAG